MQKEVKLCKECGTPIDLSRGRRDRLFCDEQCKNRHHNKMAYEEDRERKRINKILRKNRNILQKMAQRKDSHEISRERLLKAGFDFTYHTHPKKTWHYHYEYTFCYDYGYRPVIRKTQPDVYKVVKAFEEKEE